MRTTLLINYWRGDKWSGALHRPQQLDVNAAADALSYERDMMQRPERMMHSPITMVVINAAFESDASSWLTQRLPASINRAIMMSHRMHMHRLTSHNPSSSSPPSLMVLYDDSGLDAHLRDLRNGTLAYHIWSQWSLSADDGSLIVSVIPSQDDNPVLSLRRWRQSMPGGDPFV